MWSAPPHNTDGTVSIIDTTSGTIVETLRGFSLPYRMAISTEGTVAIICDAQGDRLSIVDAVKRHVLWTLAGIGSPRGVNIAPTARPRS